MTKVKKPPAQSRTLNRIGYIKFTNRVLKLRTLALVGQCLTMLKSKAICNSDRTTILYYYFKSLSSGKSRNREISKKPLIFWAIFRLQYKAKKILNQFFSMFWVSNCWNLFIFIKCRFYSNIKMPHKVKIVEWNNHFLKASRHSVVGTLLLQNFVLVNSYFNEFFVAQTTVVI